MMSRRGSILVVVVGMVGIIAAICLTFLAKARIDAGEMRKFANLAQARLCLAAACAYIQETSRLGWDDPATVNDHEEALGWVDVRDGQAGPRTVLVTAATYDAAGELSVPAIYRAVVPAGAVDAAGRPLWPNIGGISRHLCYRMERPPFAISPDVTPNQIENDPTKPLFGLPFLRKPDPQPFLTTSYANFRDGDKSPVPGSAGRGWFRLLRDGPATFVACVGSGATQGFRDWSEIVALGQESLFVDGKNGWEALLAEETRLWFRFEWSAAISINVSPSPDWTTDHGDWGHHDKTGITIPWATYANQAGTIQWIQRLRAPPEVW